MRINQILIAALAAMLWLSTALPAHASAIVESMKRTIVYAYENADKEAANALALEQTLPPGSPQLIGSYQRAAALCLIARKIPEAEKWETKVIHALEQEQPPSFEALAHAYETMSLICRLKFPRGSEPKDWQPLAIPTQVTDEFLRRQMEYNAPLAQRMRDAATEEIQWETKSVEAREMAGSESALIHAYERIALSCKVKNDYEAALGWLFKLQPLREKEQKYAFTLYEDIAKIYIIQGKFAAAETWLHKSLQSAEKTAPHRQVSLYEELSNCAMLKGNYDEALGHMQQAVSLRAQQKQAEETKRQNALEQQYSQMGAKKRAQMQAKDEAIAAAREKTEEQRPSQYAKIKEQSDFGRIYHALGNDQQAISCREAALALAKQEFKNSPGKIGRYYYELGISYRDTGNPAAMKENLRAAAENLLRAWEKDNYGHYADWLSKIYLAQGDYDQALQWKLREGAYETTTPYALHTVNYYRTLGELYALRGDKEKAAFWQGKAADIQKLYTGDAANAAVIYPRGL